MNMFSRSQVMVYDFYLTLDSTIQTFLEEAMDTCMGRCQSQKYWSQLLRILKQVKLWRWGVAQVLIQIFEILKIIIILLFQNHLSLDRLLKVYTYAAAINEGKYVGSQYFESGSRLVNGSTIRDYNTTWGTITYDEGFYRSSNTAIIDILTNWINQISLSNTLKLLDLELRLDYHLLSESAGTLPTIRILHKNNGRFWTRDFNDTYSTYSGDYVHFK